MELSEFVQRMLENAPVVVLLLYAYILSDNRVKSLTEAISRQNERLTDALIRCYDEEREIAERKTETKTGQR